MLRLFLATTFSVLIATSASAAPFRTPDLDAARTWEVQPSYEWASDRFTSETAYEMDITVPIRPGLETSVTFGQGSVKVHGVKAISGDLDSEWAMKWEILTAAEGNGFGITIEPAIIIPTGSKGLSDEQFAFEIPVIFGWNRGRYTYQTMISYSHEFAEDDNEIGINGLVMWQATDTVKLGGELATVAPANRLAEIDSEFNIGFKWEMVEGLELKGRVGQSLHREAGGCETSGALYLEKAF